MEFSDLAAKETSALLARVLATSSKASLQRVDALKAAIESAASALQEALAARPDVDREVDDLVKRLAKAAGAEADARLKHLSGEARKITDALRAELTEAVGAKEALAISLKDARTQIESVRGELQTEQKQAQSLQKQLAEAAAAHKKLDTAVAEAAAARDAAVSELAAARDAAVELAAARDAVVAESAAARATADTELKALRAQLEAGQKDARRVTADLEAALTDKRKAEVALTAATSQAQAAEAKLSAVTTLFKTSAARVQALEREQEQHVAELRDLEARVQASDGAEMAGPGAGVLDGLLGAFDALAGATTIGDVLATLGEQLAAEFPRVALFRVKGNRLEGAHQIGFDLTNDIGKVVVPLAMDSLLTRAVTSGHTERSSGEALVDTSGLPFGGSPTFALAMPVVVDGEAIAIVYADDFAEPRVAGRGADEIKVKFAEALRHHTVALLMRLTAELKAMAELRAYAGSLLTEIEQMYQSDIAAGKEGDELKKRLLANLEYARSIYSNRAQFESPAAAALLDTQLAAMIDTHRDSAFGRDLVVVAEWSAGSRAAEAS